MRTSTSASGSSSPSHWQIEGLLFWQLATLIKSEGVRLRPMLASFTFGYVCYTIIAFSYFFAAPGIFELLIAACIIGAIAKSK